MPNKTTSTTSSLCETVPNVDHRHHAWPTGKQAVSVLPMQACNKVTPILGRISLLSYNNTKRIVSSLDTGLRTS